MNVEQYTCCGSEVHHIIDSDSVISSCGRYVCKKCLTNDRDVNCTKCKIFHDVTAIEISQIPFLIDTLNSSRQEYEKLLKDKISYEDKFKRINIDSLKADFYQKCDIIENEIDIYIDSLKSELDNFREVWLGQLKELKEGIEINPVEVDEIREKYKKIQITNFNEYDKRIKELREDLESIKNNIPEIKFKPLIEEFKIDNVGEFKIIKNVLQPFLLNAETIPNGKRAMRNGKYIDIWEYQSNRQVRYELNIWFKEYEDIKC
jgi:hypothetical protein